MATLGESAMAERMGDDDFQAILGRGLQAIETEPNKPSTDNAQGRLARKAIAALRKRGIGCCFVISESDYPVRR